jgi:putative SOS response-associated peptidase YedK
MGRMCGRISLQRSPGQEHWVIRQHPKTGERTLDRLWWGLIPYWCKDRDGGRKPINAKAETVASLPSFRDPYRRRRCLLPIDNFFEWKAIKGAKAKQPYAIALKSGEPFALAGIWENWQRPDTEGWVRTFAIITCAANEMMAEIHDRMPVILPPHAYDRWLSSIEPDPRDLLVPFPAELMAMWPISTRVNKPANNDATILERVEAGEPSLFLTAERNPPHEGRCRRTHLPVNWRAVSPSIGHRINFCDVVRQLL